MKLDKEAAVKHQFWILLGSYLVVWIIAVFWLKVAAGEPIKKAEEKYKASKGKLDKAKQSPKNIATFCPPWRDYGSKFDGHKRKIWNEAYALQNGMYDWPFKYAVPTPQTDIPQDDREKYKRDLYPGQIKNLKDITPGLLGPVELKGGFEAVFNPQKWTETPTREECWLAQEDYWVKRELLYVISGAVASQAYMYPLTIDKKKEPMPEGAIARHRFRNQSWEITLLVKKDKEKGTVVSADSTIKNVNPAGRVQLMASAKGEGIVFNLYQGKTFQRFELKGEPVPADKTVSFGSDYRIGGFDWNDEKQPLAMSQAFDWNTCPVRLIEALDVGQQSCRTYTTALKPNETLAQLDAPKDAPAENDPSKDNSQTGGQPGMGMQGGMSGGAPPGGGMSGGGPPGGMSGMAPGMGQGGGTAAANVNATPNNAINRNRYLQAPKEGTDAEKPSRHLPFAIQLVTDQSHMHDILLALANSRLRIQITQVEFHRLREPLKSQADTDKNGGGGMLRTGPVFMPPGMAMMAPPGGGSMRMPPGMNPNMGSMRMPPGMNPNMSSMRPPPGMSNMRPPGMGNMALMMPGRPGSAPAIVSPTGMPRMPAGNAPPAGAGSDPKKAPQNENDENLVQVTIYGIASLYRYPDPPKTDEQGGQNTQQGQTAPTAPASPAAAVTTTPPAPAPR
jgi:hypothetical protein